MRYTRTVAVAAAIGTVGALALAPTIGGADAPSRRTVEVARLSGAAEVPGPGDPDGRGTAVIRIDGDAGTICYRLSVRRIEPAMMAHIHEGGPTVAGPVVQNLTPPTDGKSDGCVTNPTLAAEIIADPEDYYINVHNAPYPGGAVRGQLG